MADFHQTFNRALGKAAETLMDYPPGMPLISIRDRVTPAIWDVLKHFKSAAKQDNTA